MASDGADAGDGNAAPHDAEMREGSGDDADGGGRDGSEGEAEPEPVAVGDQRQKHVTLVTDEGDTVEYGEVYLKHSESEYIVSPDPEFPESETTRHAKADLHRVEVSQHHSACFITTATAGESPTLDSLRGFRDGVLSQSAIGRGLVAVYETVSPPIAATLAHHPDAFVTRVVRWLVERCADLSDLRERATSSAVRTGLSLTLTALYVLGVVVAMVGHVFLRLTGERDAAVEVTASRREIN